jgi:hypothetical protein
MDNIEAGDWDKIEEIVFVKFDQGIPRMRFRDDKFITGTNAYGNQTWTFDVIEGKEDKMLSITSKRLMLKLKEARPLEGKIFDIERVGSGMETDYKLTEVGK